MFGLMPVRCGHVAIPAIPTADRGSCSDSINKGRRDLGWATEMRKRQEAAKEMEHGPGMRRTTMTQFNWTYPETLYSMAIIGFALFEWVCTVNVLAKHGVSMGTLGAFNFYTITNFGVIMFF